MSKGIAPLILSLVSAAYIGSSASTARADTLTKSFDASAIRALLVDSSAGRISIVGGSARSVTVTARKIKFQDGCTLTIDVKDHLLSVLSREPDGLRSLERSCEVEFRIEVPRQVATELKLGSGDVSAQGLKGHFEYQLGSGNLSIKDSEIPRLEGRSGTGNVRIQGLVAEGDLKIGAGDSDISLAGTPDHGHLDVKVGTGTSMIRVPKDARLRSNFKAGMGSLTNEVGDTPSASFTISGQAGSGDMTIRRL